MVWPDNWPRYKQCDIFCDMLEGPCSCGAWHGSGEFQLIAGRLHRYGEPVNSEREMMTEFHGIKINVEDLATRVASIEFPSVATAFGTTVIGLYYTGNGSNKQLMSSMRDSVQFPITINMPCGWTITVPTLKSTYRSIKCPCGSDLHWIIKWDTE